MELRFAQTILSKFKINDIIISVNQNKTGLINQTFELSTQKNKYILQEINTKVFPNYQLGLQNIAVSYTHLRAHETLMNLVCRLLLEKNFFNITATTEIYT